MRRIKSNILWQEWTDKTFSVAISKNKLIFLYIKAEWSHLCKEIEEEFCDPGIINLIKTLFIPICVDSDERPDINFRFNRGGWPSLVILTPEGEIITGSTFLDNEDLKKFLIHCHYLYQSKSKEIQRRLDRKKKKAPQNKDQNEQEETNPSEIISQILYFLKNNFDPVYGGFGGKPKYPHHEAIELALLVVYFSKDPEIEEIVKQTLDRMAQGEIFDWEEGGFFRYSQGRDWSKPQYEKLLIDNARLLQNYLHAYQIMGEKRFLDVAQSIVQFLDSHLYNQDLGGFVGFQSADLSYYRLSCDKRKTSLRKPQYGNVVYTDWNALTICSYLEAAAVLGEKKLLEKAQTTLNLLCSSNSFEEGMFHWLGQPSTPPWRLLQDQVYMVRALLNSYQIFGEDSYLSKGYSLIDVLFTHFFDKEKGGFWDRVEDNKGNNPLCDRIKPIIDNSLAAEAIFQLSFLKKEPIYTSVARRTLSFFSRDYLRYGIVASQYAVSHFLLMQDPLLIIAVGKKGEKATQEFLCNLFALFEPRKVIRFLDVEKNSDILKSFVKNGEKFPKAYVYLGQKCRLVTDKMDEIKNKIYDLRGSWI